MITKKPRSQSPLNVFYRDLEMLVKNGWVAYLDKNRCIRLKLSNTVNPDLLDFCPITAVIYVRFNERIENLKACDAAIKFLCLSHYIACKIMSAADRPFTQGRIEFITARIAKKMYKILWLEGEIAKKAREAA